MGRQRYVSRNQNAVSFRATERTLGPVSNTIILIVLACVLGLLYLTQVTKTNAYGYQINDLDDLEVASARLQSLDRVKHSTVAANLTPVTPTETLRD
jgi:hypothetical protein